MQRIEEREASGAAWTVAREHVYGAHYLDELIATLEDGSLTFYLQDSNYNVVALAEDDGQGGVDMRERYWYEPYGTVTFADQYGAERTSGILNATLLFQGQRRDPETGLYYFKNRYYSPELGRFLQRDPAGYSQAFSLYVAARVIVCTDPYGLQSFIDKLLKSLRGSDEFGSGGKVEFGRDAGKVPKLEWRAPVESTSLPAQVEKAARNLARNAVEDAAPVRNDPLYKMAETIADVVYGAKGGNDIGNLTAPGEEDERIEAAKRGALAALAAIAVLEMTKGPDDYRSKIDRKEDRREREKYWKEQAEKNPGEYAPDDLERMKKGGAPKGSDGKSMERHHRSGDPDGPVDPMTRRDHREGEHYRKNHPWLW